MDKNAFIEALDAREDSAPLTYDQVVNRLQLVRTHTTTTSPQDQICTAASLAVGVLDIEKLSSTQILRTANIIQRIWRPYSVNVHRKTRQQVLNTYLERDHEEVLAYSQGSSQRSEGPLLTPQ